MRTAIIGYGTAIYAWFNVGARSGQWGYAPALVLTGLGVQLALVFARVLVRRYVRDQAVAAQSMIILELIADGVTVLLFALATFGAIARTGYEI